MIYNKKYKNFYKSYYVNKKFSIPFVTEKIELSKDGYSISKKEKWITNETSRKIVHLLRNKYDCILSTSKSINKDNSLLNCRIDGLNNYKPDLFIIDLNLRLRKKLLLNSLLKKRKTFLITSKENSKKSLIYKKLGYIIIFIEKQKDKKTFTYYVRRFTKCLMGGYLSNWFNFLNFLLKNNWIQDLYIFKSDKKLGKIGKNNITIKYLKKTYPKLLTINLKGDKLLKKDFLYV